MGKTTEIKFEKDPGYRSVHATTFFGTVSGRGELVFDICEDVLEYPDTIKVSQDDEGNQQEERIPEGDVTRVKRIQYLKVTIPISVVPIIIEWMQDKLKKLEELEELVSEEKEN